MLPPWPLLLRRWPPTNSAERMFIGHFAPAFLARGISEDAPRLGVLFIGAQLTDLSLIHI